MPGPLALVGGDEFHPGNEPQDELLRSAAGDRPAYVIASAARQHPEAAVATARRWFAGLGLSVDELPLRTRGDATRGEAATLASAAGFLYIAGGDPGRVVQVLRETAAWEAMVAAWRGGSALAGSSAGAMALCQWALIRASFPGHVRRRPTEALGLLPGCAVLPHFDTFGEAWIPSAVATLGAATLLIGIDERTAAVFSDGVWRVLGPGAVTLVHGAARARFATGATIEGMPQPKP